MTTDSSTGDWTPERDEEARERCAAATPGPWEIDHEGLVRTASPEMLDEPIVLASTYPGEEGRLQWSTEDRAFIAHAREDLPAALAEIERLTAELAARAPADASLEVMAMRAALTAVGFPVQDGESLDKAFARAWEWCTEMAHMARGTSVDASRPGLTEEQAREVLDLLDDAIAEQEDGDGTETSNGNARLRIATFRGIKAAILRASRGETGPAPSKPAKESDDAPDSGHDDTALTAEQYDRHKARIASGEIPGGAPTTHTVDFGCARPTHAGPEATCSLCHPAPEAP